MRFEDRLRADLRVYAMLRQEPRDMSTAELTAVADLVEWARQVIPELSLVGGGPKVVATNGMRILRRLDGEAE